MSFRVYFPVTGEIYECPSLTTIMACARCSLSYGKTSKVVCNITKEMKDCLAKYGMYAAYTNSGEQILIETFKEVAHG